MGNLKYVIKNLDKPWDWRGLSMNPNITWEFVEDSIDKPWDWWRLGMNPNITCEIIINKIEEKSLDVCEGMVSTLTRWVAISPALHKATLPSEDSTETSL